MAGALTTQRDITAGHDNVGGNQTLINSNNVDFHFKLDGEKSPIAAWMYQLEIEISTNQQVVEFIDTLQMYQARHSHDSIDGLEGKLKHAGRNQEVIVLALRKKELFQRLLTKYAMFDSAQQIFAYLLSKVEGDFRTYVLPNIDGKAAHDVDALFAQYLIGPCADEIKSGVFCLNSAIAAGMVYWLAEQCWVRWHT